MNSENDKTIAAQPSPSATQATSEVIPKEESCAHGKNTPDSINAHSRRKQGRHKRNKMGNQQPAGETDTKKRSKRKSKNTNGNRNSEINASLSSESLKSETGHQEIASRESTETRRSNECEWLPVKTAYTTAMVKRTESLREQSHAVDAACKPKTTGSRVVDSLIIQNVYTKEPEKILTNEPTEMVKENVIQQDEVSTESRDMSSLGSFEILLPPISAYDDSFENAHDDIFKDSKDTWSDDVSFTSIGEVYHSLPKHPRTDEMVPPKYKFEDGDLNLISNEPEMTGAFEEPLVMDFCATRNSDRSDSDLNLKAGTINGTTIPVYPTNDDGMQLNMIATDEKDPQENNVSDRVLKSNDIPDLDNIKEMIEMNDTMDSRNGKKDKIDAFHEKTVSQKLDDGPEKDRCIYTLIETEILRQTERCESFETSPGVAYSKLNQKTIAKRNDNAVIENNAMILNEHSRCGESYEQMEDSCIIVDYRLLIKESDISNVLQHSSQEEDVDANDLPSDHQEVDHRDDSIDNELSGQRELAVSVAQSTFEQPVDTISNIRPKSDSIGQSDPVATPVTPIDIVDDNDTLSASNNDNTISATCDELNNDGEHSGEDNQEHSIRIDGGTTINSQAVPMQVDDMEEGTTLEIKENIPKKEPEINTKATDTILSNQTGIIDTVGVETDSKVTKSANVPKSLPLSHVPPPSPSTMTALEEGEEEGSDIQDAVVSTPQDHLGETLMAKLSLLGELQSNYEKVWQHQSSDSDDQGHSREKIQLHANNDNEENKVSTNNDVNEVEKFDIISPTTTDVTTEGKSNFTTTLQEENIDLKCEPASVTMDCVNEFVSCTAIEDTTTESDTIYSNAGTDTVAMVDSSANEETHSEMSTPTPANLADTFPVMLELKHIFEDHDEQTPVAEQLPTIEPRQESKSPSGSRRRSRASPTVTDKSITESELDISEQRDDISTDSMYADDEDDFVSEVLFSKTYTEPTQGGEVLVSCTLVNTPNQDMDSDEFWAESASENAYRDIESSVNAASSTYCNARRQMQDIHHHLQDLRQQMSHLHAEIESATLSIDVDYASDDRFAATD